MFDLGALAVVLGVVAVVALIFLVMRRSPRAASGRATDARGQFHSLAGEYRGRAEGVDFDLRIVRDGNDVEATVEWVDSPPEYHIRLRGKVEPDRVILKYWRNAIHPNGADKGEALIFPTEKPRVYSGHWHSFDVPGRGEDWSLTRISDNCDLVEGEYPTGATQH